MPPEPAGWEACATPWRGHPCPRVRELPSSVSPTGPFKHAPGPGGGSGEAESFSVSLHFARLDWPAQPSPSTLCSGIHLRTLSRINPTDARALASAEVQASLQPRSLCQRGSQNETQEARPLANPGHHPQLSPRSKPMTCTSSFSGGDGVSISDLGNACHNPKCGKTACDANQQTCNSGKRPKHQANKARPDQCCADCA